MSQNLDRNAGQNMTKISDSQFEKNSRRNAGRAALTDLFVQNEIALITGVYGDPCTALLDQFAEAGLPVEISLEEKTAMAQALGASAAGKRSVVAVKQVGMNVVADPLITSVTHGIGAGLLIICGDDPGAAKSQNEQDSRWYAKLAEIPVFTPRDAQSLAQAASDGLALSDKLGIPVMLQITGRLTELAGEYELPEKLGPPPPFDRLRPWGRFILDRHKYHFENIWPQLIEQIESSALHRMSDGSGDDGVISCGYVSNLIADLPHLSLGTACPLPEKKIAEFLKSHKRVLVLEEIAPIIEEGVRAIANSQDIDVDVIGKLTGHLPRVGLIEQRHVDEAFRLTPEGLNFDVQFALSGSLNEVPCGGFEMLYQVLDSILPDEHQVAGDVGCSIMQGYFPPQTIDTAYGLGTPIGTAAGMSLSGRKGIAIIGDVGFLHSGLLSLLNAVEHGHNVLVIVLQNEIPAMTPGNLGAKGIAKIRQLSEACGVRSVDEVDLESAQPSEVKSVIERLISEDGVHVVIVKSKPVPLGLGGTS